MKLEHSAVLSILNDNRGPGSAKELSTLLSLDEREALNEIDGLLERLGNQRTALLSVGRVCWGISSVSLISSLMKSYMNTLARYKDNFKVFTYWDSEYPKSLRGVPDPPAIIYVSGSIFPGEAPIAIVGTRRVSKQGESLAYDFSRYLADHKHTVVSGLAIGIDTMAHAGALNAGGSTIAVLGTDIEHVHPLKNTYLAEEITRHGSLVSELTSNGPMYSRRFVERNRITSGLSNAILVVETPGSGGTFTQVMHARMQKRPVFIIDQHNFLSPAYREGFISICNMGGIPVSTPEELMTHLRQLPS